MECIFLLCLYANVDGFDPDAYQLPTEERGILDKWIISRFNAW